MTKLDGAPVLALTGLQFHDLVGTYTQQDVALDKLFMDVCVYNERVMGPNHVENVTDLAVRMALSYHGVSHITIPTDVQDMEITSKHRSKRNVKHHTSDVYTRSTRLPADAELQRAADILNEGKKIAILASYQRSTASHRRARATRGNAGRAHREAAARQGLRAGRQSLYHPRHRPARHTRLAGSVGRVRHTLLIVASSLPYIEFMPKPDQARGVQIDFDPKRIGLRFPVEVGLVGDSAAVLRELMPLLKRNEHRGFLEKAQKSMEVLACRHAGARHTHGEADEASSPGARSRHASAQRRDYLLRYSGTITT